MFRQKKNDPLQSALTQGPMAQPQVTQPIAAPQAPLAGGSIAAPQQPVPPAAPKFNTKLMEGDAGKLADVSHAAKSPKYDFLQLAQKGTHDYNDLGGMLSELQGGANSRLWQGWTANGDKLKFTGDPSQLAGEWNGVREVDAIGGLHDPNGPAGFRWGAEDPNGGPSGAPMLSPGMPPAAIYDNPNVSAQDIAGSNSSSLLQQILAQLNGDPSLQKALRY